MIRTIQKGLIVIVVLCHAATCLAQQDSGVISAGR